MIYAETARLCLRSLERDDLTRLAELIGDWDVARWLSVVPHPYTMQHAEEFYARMQSATAAGTPEYFLLQLKSTGEQVGAIGLHPPRETNPAPGKLIIGYWLGKSYWGQGLMSEAITPIIDLAFHHDTTTHLMADTELDNIVSQRVLQKAGFAALGTAPCRDPQSLRGARDVACWKLTRENHEQRKQAA